MPQNQLDAIDTLIVDELTKDARVSFVKLSQKLKVSNTLIHQRMRKLKEAGILKKCKITATDINEDVLESARQGIYPLRKMELNNRNYSSFKGSDSLSNYYKVKKEQVQMDARLRAQIEFKTHDLVQEDSIGNFHLVVCRNVLIYFNRELQNKVYETFTQSLGRGGFLGIGTMESMEGSLHRPHFSREDLNENIFKKIVD